MDTQWRLLPAVRLSLLPLLWLRRMPQAPLLATALAVVITGCAGTPARPTVETFADLAPSAVSMLSPEEGWVVGRDAPGPPTHIEALQYHAGRWRRIQIPLDLGGAYTGVAAVAPNDVWAVGPEGVVHYDGATWRTAVVDRPSDPHGLILQAITMLSAHEGWAVGLGGLLHYTEGHWVDARSLLPPRPTDLAATTPYPGMRSIAMLTPTNGWAVGDGGAIWHYDGTRWQHVASPPLDMDARNVALFSVQMVSPQEGWAVGGAIRTEHRNDAIIEHYTGGRWSVTARPTGEMEGTRPGRPVLRAVALSSAMDGWAAGARIHRSIVGSETAIYVYTAKSLLLQYAGGRWSEVAVPDLGTINAIALVAPGEGWAAADRGLLHLHDGTWTAVVN
ncbi:MAG: WD40/YVTN/BNR-like repeat-containing protein [Ktedonobacterales bacterium]